MTAAAAANLSQPLDFATAISLTQTLLDRLAAGELSSADLESTLAVLVATETGARGFFVVYLTDDRGFADCPDEAVISGLAAAPQVVSELLVKNLAMSAAMAIAHQRNQDEVMTQSSRRVCQRSAKLIQHLSCPHLCAKVEQLQSAIATGEGDYAQFLQRWGYDDGQKQAILAAVASLREF